MVFYLRIVLGAGREEGEDQVSEGKPQLRRGPRAKRVTLCFVLKCEIAWKCSLLGYNLHVLERLLCHAWILWKGSFLSEEQKLIHTCFFWS